VLVSVDVLVDPVGSGPVVGPEVALVDVGVSVPVVSVASLPLSLPGDDSLVSLALPLTLTAPPLSPQPSSSAPTHDHAALRLITPHFTRAPPRPCVRTCGARPPAPDCRKNIVPAAF